MMKRRFYFTLLVLAVLFLALPGFIAKGVSRVTHHPRRLAPRLAGSIGATAASRLSS
jgi:hypothetical protein